VEQNWWEKMETNILLLSFNNELAEFEAVVAQSIDDEDGSLYLSLLDTAWKTQRRGHEIVFMFPQTDWDQFTSWCGEHSLSIMKINEGEWHLDSVTQTGGKARSVCSETDRNGTDVFLDRAVDMLRAGQSMFITGEGGSGKSHLVWQLYKYALTELKWDPAHLAVTAYTGVAAQELLGKKPTDVPLNRGVTTLHAFMGIMPGVKSADQLQAFIERMPEVRARWTSTFMLIIDEISMVDGRLFTLLYEMRARFNNRMVIVCLGDFCQLPPQRIERRDTTTGQVVAVFDFCFNTPAWGTLIGTKHVITLTTNYRVDNDRDWRKLLKRVRLGHQTDFDRQYLLRLRDQAVTDEHVRIFCRRSQVTEFNQTYFARLTSDGREIKAYTLQWLGAESVINPQARNEMVQVMPLDPVTSMPTEPLAVDFMKKVTGAIPGHSEPLALAVTLCVGARVIYERNLLDEGLGNGMQGTVVAMEEDHVQVHFANTEQPIRVNFIEHVETSEVMMIQGQPRLFRVKCRLLPLQLAGAITVHKSQGMTLDKVYVKLYDEKMINNRLVCTNTIDFEGQVYVALSRCRSSANIVVDSKFELDSNWQAVKPHPDVVAFYSSLNDVTPKTATKATPRNKFGDLLDPRWLHKPLKVSETPLFILYRREKEYNGRLRRRLHSSCTVDKK
jgi:ATP-dependent DNA helicase PIF1